MNDSLPDHSAPPVADVAPKSLEEKLIADLANLNTPGDCTLWALQVSNMEELPDDVFGRVNKALMKRQAEISRALKEQDADGKPNGSKAPATAKAAKLTVVEDATVIG
jgi:hypothetical protein